MSIHLMQVKDFNNRVRNYSKRDERNLIIGWSYCFIVPNTDKFRTKGWVVYEQEKGIIQAAQWYPNYKQAKEAYDNANN